MSRVQNHAVRVQSDSSTGSFSFKHSISRTWNSNVFAEWLKNWVGFGFKLIDAKSTQNGRPIWLLWELRIILWKLCSTQQTEEEDITGQALYPRILSSQIYIEKKYVHSIKSNRAEKKLFWYTWLWSLPLPVKHVHHTHTHTYTLTHAPLKRNVYTPLNPTRP